MTDKPPIFKDIFGSIWPQMPIVFHKHYANHGFCNDVTIVQGLMNIEMVWYLRIFAPIFLLSKTLVPYVGENIPTIVRFESEQESNAFWFDRSFHFSGRKPFHFRSKMMPISGAKVIEFTKSGIGWNAAYEFIDGRVVLHHLGYVFTLFGKTFKVPIEWIFGKSTAWEEAIDNENFHMYMEIRHFLFGKIYGYSGVFKIIEVPYYD